MQYDPNEKTPVYVMTREGFKTQEEIDAAAAKPQKKYLLGSPWLSFSLFLALAAYFLNGSEWFDRVENKINQKQQEAGLEPYRAWAANHPLSYDEVASAPYGFTGRAVNWEIESDGGGFYYCEGNPAKKVVWLGPSDAFKEIWLEGTKSNILARIEGEREGVPLLMFLQSL